MSWLDYHTSLFWCHVCLCNDHCDILSLSLSLSLTHTHTHTHVHSVLEATLFSSNHLAPYNVTIRVGQPAVIDCASSYISVPSPSFDWRIYRPFDRPLQASDNMVIGLNGSLYIRNPTSSHNTLHLRCTITSSSRTMSGYIQLLIDGKTCIMQEISSTCNNVFLFFFL